MPVDTLMGSLSNHERRIVGVATFDPSPVTI
jgi:hypothetical protein